MSTLAKPDVRVIEEKITAPKDTTAAEHLHIASLDGLRGVAVIAVVLCHSGGPFTRMGWLGVDLFFVLSGFLITSLLVREHRKTGTIRLPLFWARRILRLMPAYWLYLAVVTILLLYSGRPFVAYGGWSPSTFIYSMWLYFMNYLPLGGFSYWNNLTVHLWSLCVEEQFYIVWPILCVTAITLKLGWRLPAALAVAILCWRMYASGMWLTLESSKPYLLFRLETRGFAIILGCTAAMILSSVKDIQTTARRDWTNSTLFRNMILLVTLLLIGITAIEYERNPQSEAWVVKWLTPVFAALFTLLVACLWYGDSDWISRCLCWRPLVYIGTISYGIYLYHMVAHVLTWDYFLADIEHWNHYPKFALRLGLYLLITLSMAMLSYHCYEAPFLKLKQRFRR